MAGTHHPSPFCLSGKAENWGGALLCFAAASLAHRDTEERGRVSYGAAYTFHLNSFIRILVTAILLVNFRFSIWFSVKPSVILVLPKCYLFSYLCCDLLHAPAPPDTDPTTNPQPKKRNMKIKLRSKKEKNWIPYLILKNFIFYIVRILYFMMWWILKKLLFKGLRNIYCREACVLS